MTDPGSFTTAFLLLVALATAIVVSVTEATRAAEPKTELLWSQGATGAKGDEPKNKPTGIIYVPDQEKASGTAVVICPGGGYGGLAMNHEGHDIAKWLNSFGDAGFLCDYRHRGKEFTVVDGIDTLTPAFDKAVSAFIFSSDDGCRPMP